MNKKEIGEIGERIAIEELAKFGINVALPLSDNLPFDLIVYYNDKFFKCWVKTSHKISENNSYEIYKDFLWIVMKERIHLLSTGDGDVLGNFVSSILRNTKSLDSDISKLVDDNFWDLV